MTVRVTNEIAAAVLALATACAPPASNCDPDAGTTPLRVEVAAGSECATRSFAIPIRESVTCSEIPSALEGARVQLAGHPGTYWTVSIDRTDGAPAAVCAAVLDEPCVCATGVCTTSPSMRLLSIDIGTVEQDELEIVLGAGTYVVEICSR